jgi:PHD/YefM family antitoxin component YafN of YafNO toxin-antitoxin module
MPNIRPMNILREKKILDQISQSKEPFFVTKNGNAYLVILSPDYFDEILQERDHYRLAFERERELHELAMKVKKSRVAVEQGESYSEQEFDRMLETIL